MLLIAVATLATTLAAVRRVVSRRGGRRPRPVGDQQHGITVSQTGSAL